jgi:nucleoside diphosphate kinase
VLAPQSDQSNRQCLEILSRYLESDHTLVHPDFKGDRKGKETGLVMIKPDNFERPSSLPGHIIDMFGTTGLELVGAKVFSMSVNKGKDFYGFLEEVFKKKLKTNVEEVLHKRLSTAMEFKISHEDYSHMADVLKGKAAHHEVSKIIHYMTGTEPSLPSFLYTS